MSSDTPTLRLTLGGPDPFQQRARNQVWLAFILAVANGLFLYLLPSTGATDYAWPIQPPINAAFLATGYLAGVPSTFIALFVARSWRSVRPLIWPFVALGAMLLVATLLHADRFNWSYPLTWVWTAVYILIPLDLPLLWRWHERAASAPPEHDPGLAPLGRLAWAFGLVLTALGALLFIEPAIFISRWPWPITPLLGRVLAAWYVQHGLHLIFIASTCRRAHETLTAYITTLTWSLLVVTLPLLYWPKLRTDGPPVRHLAHLPPGAAHRPDLEHRPRHHTHAPGRRAPLTSGLLNQQSDAVGSRAVLKDGYLAW